MIAQVGEQTPAIPLWLAGAAAVGVVLALLLGLLLWRAFRSSASAPEASDDDQSIDIAALRPGGPPANARQLEFYGKPVRIVVLVMAPLGRGAILPANDVLRQGLDDLIPGLMSAINVHQPIFRRWPVQLSWHGFTQSFFAKMRLPGERKGKETPWCSIAGKLEAAGQPLLAGIVLCADEPNNFSQVIAEHPGQWLDCLRVRRS